MLIFDRSKYRILTDDIEDPLISLIIKNVWFYYCDKNINHLKIAKNFINQLLKKGSFKKKKKSSLEIFIRKYDEEQQKLFEDMDKTSIF